MYLLHLPIQLVLLVLLSGHLAVARAAQSGWFLIAYLGLAVIAGRVGFVMFERPMRTWLRRLGAASPREGRAALSAR